MSNKTANQPESAKIPPDKGKLPKTPEITDDELDEVTGGLAISGTTGTIDPPCVTSLS